MYSNMFSGVMLVLLVLGSLGTIAFMLLRIRASQIQIRDAIFWIVLALALLVVSIFPQLIAWASQLLGFMAPINFVYLLVIFILLIRSFSSSVRISMLDARVQQLTQRLALYEKKHEQNAGKSITTGEEEP